MNKLQTIQEYLKARKAELVIAINSEKTRDETTGKEAKVYSNEAARAAELARRMKGDKDSKDARLNLDALTKKKAIQEIDYQYERNNFSAAKSIARILMERE